MVRLARLIGAFVLTSIFGVSVFAQSAFPRSPDAAMVLQGAKKMPNGGRPSDRTPFPAIKDWNTLKIGLQRSMCLGECPNYKVEIHGDGTVLFEGHEYTAVPGSHSDKILEDTVRKLFNAFERANFFWSYASYANYNVTDFPEYRLSLSFDGHSKELTDYVGASIGMPADIKALAGR
ncbi:MAG: DUF6438 domain-containing protein [Rhizomicrobium sp.]